MIFGTFAVVPFQAASVKIIRDESGKPVSRDVTKFNGGFHVVSSVTDSSDGIFDSIVHPAVFRDEDKAARFMEKIKRSRIPIDLNNWRIGDHPSASYQRKDENNPCFYGVV
jgi:hypothetical protein